jgi:hypothetical protein
MKTVLRLLLVGSLVGLAGPIAAQENHAGRHGDGHDKWHADFYSKLMQPGTKTSCCNLADCRPTKVRSVGDHYEVMKDARWVRVPPDKIVKMTAPDGGAHICAPPVSLTPDDPDYVFCIVMPLET